MYSLQVYRQPFSTSFIIELYYMAERCEWRWAQAKCLEHAEAEAVGIYPKANFVNGIELGDCGEIL